MATTQYPYQVRTSADGNLRYKVYPGDPEYHDTLSYQHVMPEYPDVSYEAWANTHGYSSSPRFLAWLDTIFAGRQTYKEWKEDQINGYNADVSAYNSWLGTGEGIRASAESGDYSPAYYGSGAGAASASPLNYQEVSDQSGFSEMAQGISGIFKFISALQGMKMVATQIAGQKLKNQAQQITNDMLPSILTGKLSGLNLKNDRSQFELEQLFYPRWSSHPELWKGGVFSPYGRGVYDLRDAEKSFGFQRAAADIDYRKAAKDLLDSQNALVTASKREKDWYRENLFDIQKDILLNQKKILQGEYDFQKTEQKLRKAGVIANISVGVVNALVNAVKTLSAGGLLSGIGSDVSSPSWGNLPGQSHSHAGGWDVLNGELYPSW